MGKARGSACWQASIFVYGSSGDIQDNFVIAHRQVAQMLTCIARHCAVFQEPTACFSNRTMGKLAVVGYSDVCYDFPEATIGTGPVLAPRCDAASRESGAEGQDLGPGCTS
jgi:hypothetical protein